MNKIVAAILATLILSSVAGCYVVDPYDRGHDRGRDRGHERERERDGDRGYERDRGHERENDRNERWNRDR